MTTYQNGGYFSIRLSKEIISSKELLDVLVKKYMHDELELLYQDVILDFFTINWWLIMIIFCNCLFFLQALNKENGNAAEHVQIDVTN